MREKLEKAWKWTKDHKKEIAMAVVGTGLTVIVGKEICKHSKNKHPLDAAHLLDGEDLEVFNELYSRHGDLPCIDLEDVGIVDSFWMEDGIPNAIVYNVHLEDMGRLGEQFANKASDVIDTSDTVELVMTFNQLPGD